MGFGISQWKGGAAVPAIGSNSRTHRRRAVKREAEKQREVAVTGEYAMVYWAKRSCDPDAESLLQLSAHFLNDISPSPLCGLRHVAQSYLLLKGSRLAWWHR